MTSGTVVSTSRLLLRPLVVADAPKLFAMSREDGIRRWIPDQVYRDAAHAEQVVRALGGATAVDPRVRPCVLGIEHRDTGSLIGHVGLSPARGSVEIGYAVEEVQHGHGFASEAVVAMTAWALTELALSEVLGIVEVGNTGSRRVLVKATYVYEGDEVRAVDGRERTNVLYRCTTTPGR